MIFVKVDYHFESGPEFVADFKFEFELVFSFCLQNEKPDFWKPKQDKYQSYPQVPAAFISQNYAQ